MADAMAARFRIELRGHLVKSTPHNSPCGIASWPSHAALAAAYRAPEPVCVPPLIEEARCDPGLSASIASLARKLVGQVRAERAHAFSVEALMKEFSLSSREGIALMCLAESLLRIPDRQTRDLLIRDKLSGSDWGAHIGASPSWFVNASAWGLMLTGKLVATHSEPGMAAALTRALARGGEPVIRQAMDLAMRLLGRQFVTGQTIEEALHHARPFEARGFLYSYDMLGESAVTDADAARYMASYKHAIEVIGAAQRGTSVYDRAGISVKLSALHPCYSYTQMDRVRAELFPRLRELALLASHHGIGFNIDAEEADRLEPSLDLLEALTAEGSLGGWQGLGFVIQAYQKRAPYAADYLMQLAERSGRRLMIRLVKGAYWDSEIKRAQIDGLSGYPVYTRKAYTDVCYLACAKRLLARRDLVFPQFATHNAHTLSAVYHFAGPDFKTGDYEFQCLHGMGETLYGHVVGAANLNRPCRVYAPVGTHETLLAYLVRRLLENGANSSFVHQLADASIPLEELVSDPISEAESFCGGPHPKIVLPSDLYGAARRNSQGLDLSDEAARECLQRIVEESRAVSFNAAPILATPLEPDLPRHAVHNPANRPEIVGHTRDATPHEAGAAIASAVEAGGRWAGTGAAGRAAILDRCGGLIEQSMERLCALLVREAGRTLPDAISEVREAADFCRYYASQARLLSAGHEPLGPAVCISPWNFPLAIFTGQIAAALAAGNPVLAKPAEQTPLIAAEAVRLLHQGGVPRDVLQLLPGGGGTGAALVSDPRTEAVLFTGSTEAARSIQRALACRGNVPFIAETGGQNAMIVDSSALPEQVVGDVLTSAFDSAGQRCSALRVLCLQDGVADGILRMLKGAMAELRLGDPGKIETGVGPIIDAEAQAALSAYIEDHKSRILFQCQLPAACASGTFIPPALLEIDSIRDLTHEVFGPVLHVVRFQRAGLGRLIEDINATGYGLTLGIHSRIDETIDFITSRARAGNIYVNRNMIGAVVGVQPFGGEGLSGTGPKAGGPLMLHRLLRAGPPPRLEGARDEAKLDALRTFIAWTRTGAGGLLDREERERLAPLLKLYLDSSPLPVEVALPGPAGEDNRLRFLPRGQLLGIASGIASALHQLGAALATGNRLLLAGNGNLASLKALLPDRLRAHVEFLGDWQNAEFGAVLLSDETKLAETLHRLARRPGPIVQIVCGIPEFSLFRLLKEQTISINTAAAGGNASLMTLGK
jgi:RHH-type transcriptional regulator, proline utilization regulon repressor / proline dehydrogenase / delta 1-pyrroline-5-carboxylate dehydrogenase